MPSQTKLDRLEAEMLREEIEADIIDIPEVVNISANTVYIASEEVRETVIQLIRGIPDGIDFLNSVKIEVTTG